MLMKMDSCVDPFTLNPAKRINYLYSIQECLEAMEMIYIAGPLFSEAEMKFNVELDIFLRNKGYRTFLPQRDGYKLADLLLDGLSPPQAMDMIFDKDLEIIRASDIIVMILDGRVPDEGACVEVGYAYALKKECVGLKTDPRTLISDLDNPLILGVLKNRVAKSFKELIDLLHAI